MSFQESSVGKLELKWVDVATMLTARIPSLHFETGASFEQTLDEFVLRQALREILIDCVSNNFVTTKEVRYEGSLNRIDLTIGTPDFNHLFSIELKSNSATLNQIRDDWKKLNKWNGNNKLSLYSGLVSLEEYRKLECDFNFKKIQLDDDTTVYKLAKKAIYFSNSQEQNEGEYVAFTWIWTVGVEVASLPKFEFLLLRNA